MKQPIELPKPGEHWRHYSGGFYEIIGLGHEARHGNAVVIYASIVDGALWSRLVSDFLGFTERHERRFVRHDG